MELGLKNRVRECLAWDMRSLGKDPSPQLDSRRCPREIPSMAGYEMNKADEVGFYGQPFVLEVAYAVSSVNDQG